MISEIDSCMGWNLGVANITEAVRRSVVENMKANEDLYRSLSLRRTVEFVQGSPAAPMTDTTRRYIAETCSVQLDRLGYGDGRTVKTKTDTT